MIVISNEGSRSRVTDRFDNAVELAEISESIKSRSLELDSLVTGLEGMSEYIVTIQQNIDDKKPVYAEIVKHNIETTCNMLNASLTTVTVGSEGFSLISIISSIFKAIRKLLKQIYKLIVKFFKAIIDFFNGKSSKKNKKSKKVSDKIKDLEEKVTEQVKNKDKFGKKFKENNEEEVKSNIKRLEEALKEIPTLFLIDDMLDDSFNVEIFRKYITLYESSIVGLTNVFVGIEELDPLNNLLNNSSQIVKRTETIHGDNILTLIEDFAEILRTANNKITKGQVKNNLTRLTDITNPETGKTIRIMFDYIESIKQGQNILYDTMIKTKYPIVKLKEPVDEFISKKLEGRIYQVMSFSNDSVFVRHLNGNIPEKIIEITTLIDKIKESRKIYIEYYTGDHGDESELIISTRALIRDYVKLLNEMVASLDLKYTRINIKSDLSDYIDKEHNRLIKDSSKLLPDMIHQETDLASFKTFGLELETKLIALEKKTEILMSEVEKKSDGVTRRLSKLEKQAESIGSIITALEKRSKEDEDLSLGLSSELTTLASVVKKYTSTYSSNVTALTSFLSDSTKAVNNNNSLYNIIEILLIIKSTNVR